MKILVLNSGSSSLKYQLFEMPIADVLCSGLVERIGESSSVLKYKADDHVLQREVKIENHHAALEAVVELILDEDKGVISDASEIEVVGHRVVSWRPFVFGNGGDR